MANTCFYTMKLLGSKEAVEEFARAMQGVKEFEDDGIGRVFSFEAEPAEPTSAKDIWTLEGSGDCAWSILAAMQREGVETPRSLESESARLHVAIEAYSSEPGLEFQEHVFIVDGQALVEQCVEYEEYCLENGEDDLAAFNEEHGTSYTKDDINHNGDICVGGFGDDWGRFSLLDSIERDYELLRDMPALREEKVQVSKQRDGSVSFFFAGTAINGKVDFVQDGERQGFLLTEPTGDQIALGNWSDVNENLLPLYAMEIAKYVPAETVRQALSCDRDKSWNEIKKEAQTSLVEKNARRPDKGKQLQVSEPER